MEEDVLDFQQFMGNIDLSAVIHCLNINAVKCMEYLIGTELPVTD